MALGRVVTPLYQVTQPLHTVTAVLSRELPPLVGRLRLYA